MHLAVRQAPGSVDQEEGGPHRDCRSPSRTGAAQDVVRMRTLDSVGLYVFLEPEADDRLQGLDEL